VRVHNFFIVLFFILGIEIIADDFKILSFEENSLDLSARRAKIKDNDGDYCAILRVLTDVEDLSINTDPVYLKTDQIVGEKIFFLSKEVKYVIFSANGFSDYNFEVNLKASTVYTIRVTSAQKLAGKVSKLIISSNMNNYFVSINGSPLLFCDKKISEFLLGNGDHILKFEKEMFVGIEKEIQVYKNTTAFIDFTEYSGLPIDSDSLITATITTIPEGSDVYLNQLYLGKTPVQTKLVKGGKYENLVIEQTNYESVYRNILGFNKDARLQFELTSKYCEYTINSIPTGANVYLEDDFLGKTPIYNFPVLHDSCKLKLYMPKYYTENIILLKQGKKKQNIDVVLKPNYGALEISSNPIGAKIYLDDEYVGTTPYKSDMTDSRDYLLTLKKDGWIDLQDSLIVSDLCTERRKYQLLPSDKLAKLIIEDVMSEGIDKAKFYINGKKSEIQLADTMFFSKGEISLELYHPDYFDLRKTLRLSGEKENKIKFNLKKIKKEKFKWAMNKWIALGLSACSIGSAYFLNEKANEYYDDYLLAVTSKEADELYTKTQKFDMYRNVSAGFSSAGLIWFFVSNNNYNNCEGQTTWDLR
jgi:hypothetical protein